MVFSGIVLNSRTKIELQGIAAIWNYDRMKRRVYSANAEIAFFPWVIYCQPLWTLVERTLGFVLFCWLCSILGELHALCFDGLPLPLLYHFRSTPLPYPHNLVSSFILFYFPLKNSPSSIDAAHLLIDEELEAYRLSEVPQGVFLSHLRGDMDCIKWEYFSVKVLITKLSIKHGVIKLVWWTQNQFSINKTFINLSKNNPHRNHTCISGLKSILSFFADFFWALVWNTVFIYCACSHENLTKFSVVIMFVRRVICQSKFNNLNS